MIGCLKFLMSGRIRRCNCLLALILLSCLADGLYAQENALREGDQFFLRMQYLDAIACYEKEPSGPDAHWKIAGA